jgi:hypothetical protein
MNPILFFFFFNQRPASGYLQFTDALGRTLILKVG